ncbi:MAG TPA: O-antigen ligase family protein [Gemmatimonadaceae bacterium]|jgi:O-antigen ligase|nr:O-antigen ligase family protein [Gemmatimonadaceae bacterium]
MSMRIFTRLWVVANWRFAILLLLMASLLVPVILPAGFFFPYVAPRNIFFRAVVELGALGLVWGFCFGGEELDLRYEPIFWALVSFVTAALLSALFSPARGHSLFGDFERMGGVWAWVHLAVFFLLLRALRDEEWSWLLNTALIVSMIVSVDTILQHSGAVSAAQLQDAMPAPSSSTVGNPGLLAAYLLFSITVAAYLASTNVRFRLLYLAAAGVNLLALVYAENRSTVIGLSLGAVTGSLIFAALHTAPRRRWIAPAAAIAFALMVVGISAGIRAFPSGSFARSAPIVLQRLALSNPTGADESRTMQWRAAIAGFKDRPLLGYGLENHNLAWSAHFDPGIYRSGTDVFDRTHNQYLELLATTGLIGTLAFLGIWLAIVVTLVRAYRDERISAASLAILSGLQVAYSTYLLFWFVDLNSTMLWILFAALIASRENPHGVMRPAIARSRVSRGVPLTVMAGSVVVVVVALYSEGYTPLRADRALDSIDASRASVGRRLAEFDVLTSTPSHQTAHTSLVMGQYLASLRSRYPEMRRNPAERRMLERAFAKADSTFRQEIHRDTLNDRLYTHQAAMLLDAARFYGGGGYVEGAVASLHKAIELSPHRIQPRMLLATAYTERGESERARVVLEDAVKIDPDLGEPRYALAANYLRDGKNDSALVLLESSLRHHYVGAPETYLAIGKRLEFSGRTAAAARLYSSYLEAKYTKAVWDRPGTIDRTIPTADIAVAAHLPLLYVRAQEGELAIKTAAALSAFDSSRTGLVERFVSDVGSRRRSRWVAKNSLLPCATVHVSRSDDAATLDACGVFRKKL